MRTLLSIVLTFSVFAGMCSNCFADDACPAAKSYQFIKASPAQRDPLLNEAAAFLEKNNVLFLATCDGQGARVRPVRYTVILDNKLAIASSTQKELSQQIARNPQVEVSAVAADGSAFFRYQGKAVACTDAAITGSFLAGHPKFKKMFGENFVLFLVTPEKVGLFPMKKGTSPKTKTFAQ